MVAIARALLNENPVLLVDEPTKGLAPLLVTEVAAALERAAELATVLLVEQNLAVVARVAQQVVVLDVGRVVHTGRRPSCSAIPSASARSSACTEAGIEHLRPPDDHRARPRRDVLPDRLRPLADLRPDGRAQLRARRLPHRRRVRRLVDVDARRRRAGTKLLVGALFGLAVGALLAALVELVADPAALPATDRAGARHGRPRARPQCARRGDLGLRRAAVPGAGLADRHDHDLRRRSRTTASSRSRPLGSCSSA